MILIKSGVETIIGISNEEPFAPTLLFRLGGIFVEALQDVSIRVLPVTKREVEHMISQILGYKIWEGIRGRKPVDIEALSKVLLKVCLPRSGA